MQERSALLHNRQPSSCPMTAACTGVLLRLRSDIGVQSVTCTGATRLSCIGTSSKTASGFVLASTNRWRRGADDMELSEPRVRSFVLYRGLNVHARERWIWRKRPIPTAMAMTTNGGHTFVSRGSLPHVEQVNGLTVDSELLQAVGTTFPRAYPGEVTARLTRQKWRNLVATRDITDRNHRAK